MLPWRKENCMKGLKLRFFIINGALLACSVLISLFYLYVKKNGITAFDCSFMRAFGFPCPSCGATRAVLALLTLHIFDAIKLSPAVFICALLLLFYDTLAILAMIRRRPEIERYFSVKLLIIVPFAFLVPYAIRIICFFLV